jgi:hypothetical protein
VTVRARFGITLLILAAQGWFGAARASAEARGVELPVVVHMAHEGGEAVADRDFLEGQFARANEIFSPYGVRFVMRELVEGPLPARMESRDDRSGLGAHVQRGVINCFVVASLRDVDEPERMRRGVHWHSQSHAGAHYVILSAISEPEVLAHELGHYLGNPRHSDTPGNLMSYQRTDALPFLDAAQQRRVKLAIRRYVRAGELRVERR